MPHIRSCKVSPIQGKSSTPHPQFDWPSRTPGCCAATHGDPSSCRSIALDAWDGQTPAPVGRRFVLTGSQPKVGEQFVCLFVCCLFVCFCLFLLSFSREGHFRNPSQGTEGFCDPREPGTRPALLDHFSPLDGVQEPGNFHGGFLLNTHTGSGSPF